MILAGQPRKDVETDGRPRDIAGRVGGGGAYDLKGDACRPACGVPTLRQDTSSESHQGQVDVP
jgi:hypothetical protein